MSTITTVSGDGTTSIPNLSVSKNLSRMYIDYLFPFYGCFIGYPTPTDASVQTSETIECGIYLNETNKDTYAYTAISTININSPSDLPIVIYMSSSGGVGASSPKQTGQNGIYTWGPGGGGGPVYLNVIELILGTATPPYIITCKFKLWNTITTNTTYTGLPYINSVALFITIGNEQPIALGTPYYVPANENLDSLNGLQGSQYGAYGSGGYQNADTPPADYYGYVNIISDYLTAGYKGGSGPSTSDPGGNSGMSEGFLLNIIGLKCTGGLPYVSSGGAIGTDIYFSDDTGTYYGYIIGDSFTGGAIGEGSGIGGGNGGAGETDTGNQTSNGGNGTSYGSGGGGGESSTSQSYASEGGLGTAGFALILTPIPSTS